MKEKEEQGYNTRSGRSLKRPANFNISLGGKKKLKQNTPKKISTNRNTTKKMANVTPAKVEVMRAQLQNQQQEIEQARRAVGAAQQQHRDLELARQQLLVIQNERDEAQRVLNDIQQNGRPNAQRGVTVPPAPQNQQVVSIQGSDIGNLVGAVGFSQLEYRLPKFIDENDCHPLEFLEKMEKFFKVQNISEERKISAVEIALDGNARLWFNSQSDLRLFILVKMLLKHVFSQYQYK